MLMLHSVVLACLAVAVSEPPPPPPLPVPPAILAGPDVDATTDAAAKISLVRRDFAGDLERLDVRPEVAALDLLGLTAEERALSDNVLTERAAAVSRFLDENYDVFIKLQQARQAGTPREDMRPLIGEFRTAASALLRPSLQKQVAAALPGEKRLEFTRLVDEYNDALAAADEMAGAPAGDGARRAGPLASRARVEINLTIREVAQSLKSLVESRRERLDALSAAIEATPEQDAAIRRIAREFAAENGFSVKGGNRTEVVREMFDLLTPEQRRRALSFLRGQ